MARPAVLDLEGAALSNRDYRRVLATGVHTQIVVMRLKPGEDIGEEVHDRVEQTIFLVEGDAEVVLGRTLYEVEEGDAILIPPGARHNLVNVGAEPLCLYTIYSPPNHIDGTVHRTKMEAEADVEDERFGQQAGRRKV